MTRRLRARWTAPSAAGTTVRFFTALAGLAAITVFGTLGYVLIEGLPWFDALYMAVITLS